jgi:PTH1 family peptidyl-tRNA hydrolase
VYLVVGLGNPGPKYASHRHNVGFMVVTLLGRRWGAPAFREKFKGLFSRAFHAGEDVVLLQPMTYMNLSGESVRPAMDFFKVPLDRVLVVHDELDLRFGTCRLKVGGGAAGHNGLKSVTQHGGGNGYLRLRMGIDRPKAQRPESYVLSDFSASERAELPDLLERAGDMVESVIADGVEPAMNRWHTK